MCHVARMRVGEDSGAAQIHDDAGTLHEIQCRADAPLDKGERLVVVDYDDDSGLYVVVPLNPEPRPVRRLEA